MVERQDYGQQGGGAGAAADFIERPHVLRSQKIEVTFDDYERTRRRERDGGGGRQNFASCVHAGADSSQSWSAAATTISVVTAAMQRWSMGHSRSRQGLHSACARTTRARGPVGPVVVSSVAPNMARVGTPSALETCMAPESLVRKRRQAAARSMNSRRVVWPAKLCELGVWAATDWQRSRSDADPKSRMEADGNDRATAAKQIGSAS